MDISPGHASLKIEGERVWRAFKYEPGSHCVQRYPDNDRGGRRHTSIVSVGVMPLPPERDFRPLPSNEINIITQRGHGKGGQHQNKTDSAVRMTHVPTGLQVFINGRDQHQNKKTALRILTARVNDEMNRQRADSYNKLRKELVGSGTRGAKIRTYNFIKHRVTDHVRNTQTTRVDAVMDGGFDLLNLDLQS